MCSCAENSLSNSTEYWKFCNSNVWILCVSKTTCGSSGTILNIQTSLEIIIKEEKNCENNEIIHKLIDIIILYPFFKIYNML